MVLLLSPQRLLATPATSSNSTAPSRHGFRLHHAVLLLDQTDKFKLTIAAIFQVILGLAGEYGWRRWVGAYNRRAPGIAFFGFDAGVGQTREIWFIHNHFLFEVMM